MFPSGRPSVATTPIIDCGTPPQTWLLFHRAKALARLYRLVVLGLAVVGGLLGAFVLALLWPTLPPLDALTDYQPKIPLRVVSADGDLLGEFGEERRAVVRIGEV